MEALPVEREIIGLRAFMRRVLAADPDAPDIGSVPVLPVFRWLGLVYRRGWVYTDPIVSPDFVRWERCIKPC